MILEAKVILQRLDDAIVMIRRYLASINNADEQRYAISTAGLLQRERDKLALTLASSRQADIRWALRSTADMIKGLIDIGSSWREDRPDEWRFVTDTADMAHQVEAVNRDPV